MPPKTTQNGPSAGSGSGAGQSRPTAGGRRKNKPNGAPTNKPAASKQPEQPATDIGIDMITKAAADLAVESAEDEGDADTCFICAEPVKYYALGQCNHRTCHVCAVRLRALYKKMECTFCKETQHALIITNSPDRLYLDYTPDDLPFTDDKLKVSFESNDMMQDTLLLLRFNCPETDCTAVATGWSDLKFHTKDMHGLLLCDICIRHKKIFAHEHTLYPPRALLTHVPSMKRPPQMPPQHRNDTYTEKDLEVEFVHPMCAFCRDCFYGNDELYAHLREKHEKCFVCEKMGQRDVFFQNYQKLDEHFQNAHHPCPYPACLEQKFIVFPSAIDLKAHQIEQHGEAMTGRQRRENMRLDVVDAGFSFDEVRSGGRRRGGAPTSDATEAPRGAAARRAAFGRSLTEAEQSSTAPNGSTVAQPVIQNTDLAELQNNLRNLNSSAQFTILSAVRSFRASESSPHDMLNIIYSVFDHNLESTGSIVARILDVFQDQEEKKTDLLSAWNGMKTEERNHYPSIAPVSAATQSQTAWAGIASGRVINVKRQTQPVRSHHQTATRRVWDRVEQAATSSQGSRSLPMQAGGRKAPSLDAFPSLAAAGPSTSAPSRSAAASATKATPWATRNSTPSQTPAPSVPKPFSVPGSPAPRAGPRPPPAASTSQFPGLPSSSRAAAPREFIGGNKSLKSILGDGSSAAPSRTGAWGTPAAGTPQSSTDVDAGDSGDPGGRKKKKGKEKLFTLGTYT